VNTGRRARQIIVCADDFGLTEAASRSIVQLAAARAISALSCVVDGPFAQRFTAALTDDARAVSRGLHLNLTALPDSALNATLRTWLWRCVVMRRGDHRRLIAEIERQFDAFEALFGGVPDFVDGHEHVHQLPVVRDALLAVMQARCAARAVVRTTVPQRWRGTKAQLIAELGGRTLRRRLAARGWRSNSDFAGVYGFDGRLAYAQRMRGWLHSLADGGLIMCHPELPLGHTGAANVRHAEHQFLASPEWPQLLASQGIRLMDFTPTP
jgi:predicted glycoside hydrolase/deacetylase ChbG (UPF0249 family)